MLKVVWRVVSRCMFINRKFYVRDILMDNCSSVINAKLILFQGLDQ